MAPRHMRSGWPMIIRTRLIDDLVLASLRDGCDCVANLSVGLDTRPYRLSAARLADLDPDFRLGCDGPNLLMLSDAFIHEGSEVRNTLRRTYTQWVKSKTGRFSSVSTGF